MSQPETKRKWTYVVSFLHHNVVRTKAVVEAENDIEALKLSFDQLIAEGWNKPGEYTWANTGDFQIKFGDD